jgi:hypothetical protein
MNRFASPRFSDPLPGGNKSGRNCILFVELQLCCFGLGRYFRKEQVPVSAQTLECLLMFGLFAGGALAGLLSRWGPLSGWAALALPLVLPALGIGLTRVFC